MAIEGGGSEKYAHNVVLSSLDHVAPQNGIFASGALPLVVQKVYLLEKLLLMVFELSLHGKWEWE